MDGTTSGLLDSVTQRTLYAQNFNRASSQASHVLTDLLCRYISLLASTCARYADHAGRTTVAMPDAILALDELGLSVDELAEYVGREGRDLNAEGYTMITSRRAEELALLKETLKEGGRIDHDDAVTLVYGEVPEISLNGHISSDEDEDAEASEDEEYAVKREANGDIVMLNGSGKAEVRLSSPALPPSPVSNPSSPSRKRPRLANWNAPSYVPDFLPPYPTSVTGESGQLDSPLVKSESDAMPPPHSVMPERERLPTPLPQQLSTAASAADYLTPVPYNMSSLSSVSESHLPDKHAFRKASSSPGNALQLQPRKHATPEITPTLLGAYHHMLTNPPPPHPSTNPARHRVALAMLAQAYTKPRWTAADTLFGSAAAPRPRVVAPGPSYPVPISGKGKDDQLPFIPYSSSRPIIANEAVVLPSFQPKSRIPDITKAILPLPVFNRATRVYPPPPLVNNTTKEKLLYGSGIPAPWNSDPTTQGGATTRLGKSKDKVDDDDDDGRRRERTEDNAKVLPDAVLLATWDWEAHDFRQPLTHRRSRTLGSFSLGSAGHAVPSGVDGAASGGGLQRKNSIKLGKGR